MRAATSDAHFLYIGFFAPRAERPLFSKYFEMLGKISGVTVGVCEVLKCGSTNFNWVEHNFPARSDDRFGFRSSKWASFAVRTYLGCK